jgi:hypothetical protein
MWSWGMGVEPESDSNEPVRPVKIERLYKFGTTLEPRDGPIAYVGDIQMPIFRVAAVHPLGILYMKATTAWPMGFLLIGLSVDIVACAVTCSFDSYDREMLRGMKISPNFAPDPPVQATAT